MVQEPDRHREQDRQRKEEVETRNRADSVIYAAEKALREAGDKVPGQVRSDVEAKVKAVRDALGGSDVAAITARTDELGTAMQQIGASMYEQPSAAPGPEESAGPSDDGGEPPEDVVEGEFEET